MRKLTTLLFLLLSGFAFSLSARSTTVDTIKANPGKAGGVYYAYPVTSSLNTPVPKGYKPFYISHYGRHGSRYLINDRDYSGILGQLKDAADHGALTARGLGLLSQLDTIWDEARGRGGELSPLGVRQHKAIAGRMYDAFPEVFNNEPAITAKSTTVMRCAHSMFAFIEALKEKKPSLDIPRESGTRAMDYLNYHSPESGKYSGHDGAWYLDWRKFKNEKTRPERLISEIFSDSTYVRRHIDPVEFMWSLYWVAVDLQNMETDIELWDLFTAEELFNLWEVFNFNFYACNTSYPLADGQHTDNAANLVRNIIETADEYVASPKNGATLRFRHDGNIIPMAA
ncbi:MAG: histidine-type phosphatase, partial [Muribaculaceae bacterium]|nr:histidine-type phosphatase [Muribaculaceae bacterium]